MKGDIVSDKLVKVLVEFRVYCEEQGDPAPLETLDDICEQILILFNVVRDLWPVVLDIMGPTFVMTIFGAEQIIDRGLKDGISRKRYYKDIYKDVRAKVELFAKLHGKSEVISKQLASTVDPLQ